jgi:hypothetical protein
MSKKRERYYCKICNNEHIIRKCKTYCNWEGTINPSINTLSIFYCKVCDRWFFYEAGLGHPTGTDVYSYRCNCCKSIMHKTSDGLVYAIKTRDIDIYELLRKSRDNSVEYYKKEHPTTLKDRYH